MIIAAKVIRRPRHNRKCSACECFIGAQPLLQLYGAAERGDQPYSMWLHLACAEEWAGTTSDQKITAALEEYKAKGETEFRTAAPTTPTLRELQ